MCVAHNKRPLEGRMTTVIKLQILHKADNFLLADNYKLLEENDVFWSE